MHELSIVLSIIDIAEEQVQKTNAYRVERIDLDIGTLAGIEVDSLEFVWDTAVKNTVLAGSERRINCIQAKARCLDCGLEFDIDQLFATCPQCGQFFTELVQGRELKVKSLVMA